MATNITLTTIAITAALLIPAAGATWSSYGAFEPDTSWDVPALMWHEAPGTITNRVYFNAFIQYGDGGPNGGVANPNVGMLQTRFDPVGERAHEAIFGVWTDCNQDGYIGMAETAVREYHASMLNLAQQNICPASTGPKPSWNGANNYNGWVTELIPIGNADAKKADARVWLDTAAKVWGDPGQPDDPAADVAPGCPPLQPIRGHGDYVGGYIASADCHGRRGVVATWDSALGPLGLAWGSDPEHSSSPLNVPIGDDSSEHSAVYAQDCSQEPILTTGTALPGADFDNLAVLRPVPANPVNSDPSSWTVPGTMNYTIESIGLLPPSENGFGNMSTSNCDFEDDSGRDFYRRIEVDPAASQEDGKNRATWNFFFNTATRGSLPASAIGSGAGGVPTDFGVEATTYGCTASSCMQSLWVAGGSAIYAPPLVRGDALSGGLEFAAAPRYSYYASIGSETTARGFVGPGGSGKYGSAQCGLNTAGEHNGWNCDPNAWYLLASGLPQPEPDGIGVWARVGTTYQFRDVDCYDGGGLGIGISPAFYGTANCSS